MCLFTFDYVSLLFMVRFERIRLFDIRCRLGLLYKLSSCVEFGVATKSNLKAKKGQTLIISEMTMG